MRKTRYFPYILLILFLFSVLSISKVQTQKIRGMVVSCICPFWNNVNDFSFLVAKLFGVSSKKSYDFEKYKNI